METPREPRAIAEAIQALAKARGWTLFTAEERAQQLRERRALGPEYADCHCMGEGGSGEELGMILERDPVILAHVDNQPVMVWKDICPCPDGQRYRRELGMKRQRAVQQLAARRVQHLLGAAEVPLMYRGLTVESWQDRAVAEGGDAARIGRIAQRARTWLAHAIEPPEFTWAGPVLLLAGNWGAGKTGLAAALLGDWIGTRRGALFRTAPGLVAELRSAPYQAHGDEVPTWQQVMLAYQTVPLLVLDDLGAEAGTGDQGEQVRALMYQIVNERIAWLRPTIITTNLAMDAIAARYGGGMQSRLNGDETRRLVLMTPDLRAADGQTP